MLDSVKYAQADLCPLVDFGSPDSLFYLSELAYLPSHSDFSDLYQRLQRLAPEHVVVFPASFLGGPKALEQITQIELLLFQKRLLISLGEQELKFRDKIQALRERGWNIDLSFDRPLQTNNLATLSLYDQLQTRLILISNRYFHQFKTVASVPENWRNRLQTTFLPPGERQDILLSEEEVIALQEDWVKAKENLNLPELNVLSFKPLVSTVSWTKNAQFYGEPSASAYAYHFQNIGELSWLRRWMFVSYTTGSALRMGLLTGLFSLVRPLETLMRPLRKAFWFLNYQFEKRILGRVL